MKASKNILLWILAIALIVIAVIWFMGSGLEHIEDTNGPDNYSLTTITDADIVKMSTGSLGGPNRSKSLLTGDAIEFSAKKFTGVYEVLYDNFIGKSDFVLDLTAFTVSEGNFKMVVVHNDEIVATLEPDLFVTYRLDNVKGTVSLRIAGESAAFSFCISEMDYNLHSHVD